MIKIERQFKDLESANEFLFGSKAETAIAQAVLLSDKSLWCKNHVGETDYSFFSGYQKIQNDYGYHITLWMPECDQDVQDETFQEIRSKLS